MKEYILTEKDIVQEIDCLIERRLVAHTFHYEAWGKLVKDLLKQRHLLIENLYANVPRPAFEKIMADLGYEWTENK